jgi:hypothetical protein
MRRALGLAWGSLGWMTAEGSVGLAAGLAAGSVALTGWALGSVIEGLASGCLDHLIHQRRQEHARERADAHPVREPLGKPGRPLA